ncbi:helix-turn-helix domain-containing protein [Oligoflexus tunisiensis]|uniref:helix-turn-helix domain-containing protein n=1 Tax=Oligoflexus tunisiensis TaxID=708132 RepID=UPI00114D1B12|nr:helix-turn-helix transcriptional regulator [Oligoflexus tunisiensis]
MEIKKTEKGWEYGGVLFKDERSAQLSKQADEAASGTAKAETLPPTENFQLVYDGSQGKSFGKFIDKVLKEKNISISKLAKELGVSRPTLYAWMSGASIPTELNLDKIYVFTKATPDEIFNALADNFEGQKEIIRQKIFALPKVSGH